jgi:hypothetical protein
MYLLAGKGKKEREKEKKEEKKRLGKGQQDGRLPGNFFTA